MRRATTTVALFTSLVTGVAFLLVVAELGGPPSLAPEQVSADGHRLAALHARTRLETPGTSRLVQITYTFADRCGAYQGLALIGDRKLSGALAEPETLLAFLATPRPGRLPRGPSRPDLPALYLQRDPMGSDLVPPGDPRRLLVTLAPGPWSAGESRVTVTLGNVAGRPDLEAASLVGLALGAVVRPHHCKLGPDDPWVLAMLARLVRARLCDGPGASRFCAASALTLYRDSRPMTYRLDVRGLGGDPRRAAFGLAVRIDEQGRLLTAEVRLLAAQSALDRRAVVSFTRPRAAGEPSPAGEAGTELIYEPGAKAAVPLTVDLAGLLAGTGWQDP